jgi:hypothetical protein
MKDYFVKEAYGLERIHHVMATSKEEAISIVNEYIINDIDDFVIEETETEDPLMATTFDEEKEEITTEK